MHSSTHVVLRKSGDLENRPFGLAFPLRVDTEAAPIKIPPAEAALLVALLAVLVRLST